MSDEQRIGIEDVRWLLRWAALLLPVGAIAVAFFIDGWPAQRYLVFYVAPLFFAATTWMRLRLDDGWPAMNTRFLLDVLVLGLSFLRFVIGTLFPFSGHMLFLTYSALTIQHRGYRFLAVVLLLETTWFKLWLWRDPYTWLLGLVLGLLAYERWRSSHRTEPAAAPPSGTSA
jgi:hypothetical protein